jgi:hypothetical protein
MGVGIGSCDVHASRFLSQAHLTVNSVVPCLQLRVLHGSHSESLSEEQVKWLKDGADADDVPMSDATSSTGCTPPQSVPLKPADFPNKQDGVGRRVAVLSTGGTWLKGTITASKRSSFSVAYDGGSTEEVVLAKRRSVWLDGSEDSDEAEHHKSAKKTKEPRASISGTPARTADTSASTPKTPKTPIGVPGPLVKLSDLGQSLPGRRISVFFESDARSSRYNKESWREGVVVSVDTNQSRLCVRYDGESATSDVRVGEDKAAWLVDGAAAAEAHDREAGPHKLAGMIKPEVIDGRAVGSTLSAAELGDDAVGRLVAVYWAAGGREPKRRAGKWHVGEVVLANAEVGFLRVCYQDDKSIEDVSVAEELVVWLGADTASASASGKKKQKSASASSPSASAGGAAQPNGTLIKKEKGAATVAKDGARQLPAGAPGQLVMLKDLKVRTACLVASGVFAWVVPALRL